MTETSSNQDYSAGCPSRLEFVVPAECAGLRLDQALARLLPEYSRSRLTAWIKASRVAVDGRHAIPRLKVQGGERLAVDATATCMSPTPAAEARELAIVHEDDALIVVDKPPGLVVHPGSGNWHGTLLNALLHRYPELAALPRAGIVHRLDKDTSGLLVVARTLPAHTGLVRDLAARKVERIYVAVAHGRIARDGTIDAPIGRDRHARVRMAVDARGRPARTHYRVRERYPAASLVECRLETGRTHQIRVHMRAIGHPLVGDPTYGRRTPIAGAIAFARQALHAHELRLTHPVGGQPIGWISPLPPDMCDLLASLRSTIA